MELTFDYIKQHEVDFLPKESVDYCERTNHYHYNQCHGEWSDNYFNVIHDKAAFKQWYKENITPVWAIMPVIVRGGAISGRVVEGFIIKNYVGELEFTSTVNLNTRVGHVVSQSTTKDPYYQKEIVNFHMFDNKAEAEKMYESIVAGMQGESTQIRIQTIDSKIAELTSQIERLQTEKQQLLK